MMVARSGMRSFLSVNLPECAEQAPMMFRFVVGNPFDLSERAVAGDIANLAVAVRDPKRAVLNTDDHHDLAQHSADGGDTPDQDVIGLQRHAVSFPA